MGRKNNMSKKGMECKPIMRLKDSLTYSNLWLSILSLASGKKVYAYNLPEEINQEFGFLPSRLMIYLVLYKLEGEGFLKSHEEGQRRYYLLTPDGRRCLQEGKRILKARANQL